MTSARSPAAHQAPEQAELIDFLQESGLAVERHDAPHAVRKDPGPLETVAVVASRMEESGQTVHRVTAVRRPDFLAQNPVLAPSVDVEEVERRQVGVELLRQVEPAEAGDGVDRPAVVECDLRLQVEEVDRRRILIAPVPRLPAVLQRDSRGFVAHDHGERVGVGVVAQPGDVEPHAVVRSRPKRELPADGLLVGALHVFVPAERVGGRAAGVTILDGQARGEDVVDELHVLHHLDVARAEPAPFETNPPFVAVEGGLVVVDQDRSDQCVGSLQRRLRTAQDLDRSDVEQRRVQVVAGPRAERRLVQQDRGERVGVAEAAVEAVVVDAADAVRPELGGAGEGVGGPVEDVLDGEDGLGLESFLAEVRDAGPELLPAGVELAADDDHFLGKPRELQHGVQDGGVRSRHANPAPPRRLEAGQRERDRIVAGRQPVDEVPPLAVGDRRAGPAGKRRSGRFDRHSRQYAAGPVGDGAGDGRVLPQGRQRQREQAGDGGNAKFRHAVFVLRPPYVAGAAAGRPGSSSRAPRGGSVANPGPAADSPGSAALRKRGRFRIVLDGILL